MQVHEEISEFQKDIFKREIFILDFSLKKTLVQGNCYRLTRYVPLSNS